jgi:hypothetical protein
VKVQAAALRKALASVQKRVDALAASLKRLGK